MVDYDDAVDIVDVGAGIVAGAGAVGNVVTAFVGDAADGQDAVVAVTAVAVVGTGIAAGEITHSLQR